MYHAGSGVCQPFMTTNVTNSIYKDWCCLCWASDMGSIPALSFLPKQIAQAMRAQTRGRRPADESALIDAAAITGANQLTTAISIRARSGQWQGSPLAWVNSWLLYPAFSLYHVMVHTVLRAGQKVQNNSVCCCSFLCLPFVWHSCNCVSLKISGTSVIWSKDLPWNTQSQSRHGWDLYLM